MATKHFYRVHFHTPVEGIQDYYFQFASLIYERFNAHDIGITRNSFFACSPKPGVPRVTRKCTIYYEEMAVNPKKILTL